MTFCSARWGAFLGMLMSLAVPAVQADPLVEQETGAAQARIAHGVTGRGVAVAILDRGIDWTHPDFRNADGSTRIAYIFDLTDNSGASANPYGVGTVYTAAQINAALSGGPPLATRDAVGHGTATAGNCCGNGRGSNGLYVGIAPEATLIVVKFTSDGAPAHDGQPAEAAFYQASLFGNAVDFAVAKAAELGMPLVMLANFGSIGERSDGRGATFAQKIDATVGPGIGGRVFVTGSGDDGGRNNHAAGQVSPGLPVQLQVQKGSAGTAYVYFWYPSAGRLQFAITTPTASYGPYAPPANDNYTAPVTTAEFTYAHNGSIYYDSNWRLAYFLLTGAAGTYTVTLASTTTSATTFDAYVSPGYYSLDDANRFLNYAVQEKTIWSGASAMNNIAPNSYVVRTTWQGLDGYSHSLTGQGEVGELWHGSSVGPTMDGRIGIDFAAPGDRNITTYAPTSYWGSFTGNNVSDGNGLYGVAGAVSAAAPLAAGAAALILQKNPALDATQVRAAMRQSARADAYTGTVPNSRFGYGKLDISGALALVQPGPLSNSKIDCLFGWAEGAFPQFFSPVGASSATYGVFRYRHYAATGNFLAVSSVDNHVLVLGPEFGDGILPIDVGLATSYLATAGCQ